MSKRISRRTFLSATAAAPVVLSASEALASSPAAKENPGKGTWVRWLDDRAGTVAQGASWGTPWPRGKVKGTKECSLRDASNKLLPLQSWALAYWPDGSLKWTGHALAPTDSAGDGPFEVVAQRGPKAAASVSVKESGDAVE